MLLLPPQAETDEEKAALTPAGLSVEDEELVVVALLHDIGETLSPINHGEVAAGTRNVAPACPVCPCASGASACLTCARLGAPVALECLRAGILRPFISPRNYWILMHHEIFQLYYYGEAAGSCVPWRPCSPALSLRTSAYR